MKNVIPKTPTLYARTLPYYPSYSRDALATATEKRYGIEEARKTQAPPDTHSNLAVGQELEQEVEDQHDDRKGVKTRLKSRRKKKTPRNRGLTFYSGDVPNRIQFTERYTKLTDVVGLGGKTCDIKVFKFRPDLSGGILLKTRLEKFLPKGDSQPKVYPRIPYETGHDVKHQPLLNKFIDKFSEEEKTKKNNLKKYLSAKCRFPDAQAFPAENNSARSGIPVEKDHLLENNLPAKNISGPSEMAVTNDLPPKNNLPTGDTSGRSDIPVTREFPLEKKFSFKHIFAKSDKPKEFSHQNKMSPEDVSGRFDMSVKTEFTPDNFFSGKNILGTSHVPVKQDVYPQNNFSSKNMSNTSDKPVKNDFPSINYLPAKDTSGRSDVKREFSPNENLSDKNFSGRSEMPLKREFSPEIFFSAKNLFGISYKPITQNYLSKNSLSSKNTSSGSTLPVPKDLPPKNNLSAKISGPPDMPVKRELPFEKYFSDKNLAGRSEMPVKIGFPIAKKSSAKKIFGISDVHVTKENNLSAGDISGRPGQDVRPDIPSTSGLSLEKNVSSKDDSPPRNDSPFKRYPHEKKDFSFLCKGLRDWKAAQKKTGKLHNENCQIIPGGNKMPSH